jgi:hypothetical protein
MPKPEDFKSLDKLVLTMLYLRSGETLCLKMLMSDWASLSVFFYLVAILKRLMIFPAGVFFFLLSFPDSTYALGGP